ncbi:MAG: DUF3536 domain-containing protein [Desulfobulbaceae bacterium]|nr:DUF3536 domain-containing protein [Desulfobulbaceae bacterium]
MTSYVCIHCHLYQPPRENPWLERIEIQDSAYPYHDWNVRINAECYGPNASSRMLDSKGRITRIVNNYENISFNFGPTLIDWLQRHAPSVYEKIIDADRLSIEKRSGHGNAIAQAYNHMILPLANRRDKVTQVTWGIRSFEKHFNRQPEGMWLPETAVDIETLEILADQGIKFTILAPGQANRKRPLGKRRWHNVAGGAIDTRLPYVMELPCGGSMVIFFYNGQIAHDVAFGDLLVSGENLAKRILAHVQEKSNTPPLIHIATDGETFGHHHRFGDMALAYANVLLEQNDQVKMTNYGEYLALHPPGHEVEIHNNSSWSCIHGIERWRSNCGCSSGYNSGWNQSWRAPLRESLDRLRFKLIRLYAREAAAFFSDPWKARNLYLDVIMDRSEESKKAFLEKTAAKTLSREELKKVWRLLEMQRNAMLMFTSCGWFFDEISGIEPVQILCYAARAIELANYFSRKNLEESFLEQLSGAVSNIETMGNGADIYRKFVLPSKVSLRKVAAHAAISSFFTEDQEHLQVGCFHIIRQDSVRLGDVESGIAAGRIYVSSLVTESSKTFVYAALQQNLHDFQCAVRPLSEIVGATEGSSRAESKETAWEEIAGELADSFQKDGRAAVRAVFEKHFDAPFYSISDLFRDEQQQLLKIIIQEGLESIEKTFEQAYNKTSFLMGLVESLGHRLPATFKATAEIALKREIVKRLDNPKIDADQLEILIKETKGWDIELDQEWFENVMVSRLARETEALQNNPSRTVLQRLNVFLTVLFLFPAKINLWETQNVYYEIMADKFHAAREKADAKDETARLWLDEFLRLGSNLQISVEELSRDLS